MYCPMLRCEWQVSGLIPTEANPEQPRAQDDLVTQFYFTYRHLVEEHDAVIGGLMPDGTYPPGHEHAGEKAAQ